MMICVGTADYECVHVRTAVEWRVGETWWRVRSVAVYHGIGRAGGERKQQLQSDADAEDKCVVECHTPWCEVAVTL